MEATFLNGSITAEYLGAASSGKREQLTLALPATERSVHEPYAAAAFSVVRPCQGHGLVAFSVVRPCASDAR